MANGQLEIAKPIQTNSERLQKSGFEWVEPNNRLLRNIS